MYMYNTIDRNIVQSVLTHFDVHSLLGTVVIVHMHMKSWCIHEPVNRVKERSLATRATSLLSMLCISSGIDILTVV